MHIEDLKAQIRKAGVTQKELARAVGLSPSHVSMALRTGTSAELNAEVARVTGLDPCTIWPVYSRPNAKPQANSNVSDEVNHQLNQKGGRMV